MNRDSWNYAVDNADDGEDGFQGERYQGRDYLIFLVDCSESMMETKLDGEKEETLFQSCLKAVTSMYRKRCSTCDKDYLGVLLYNTAKSKNSHSFENISVLLDLSLPDAKQVKQLEALLTKNGRKDFKKEYGHGEAKMDEVFWMAGTMFSTQGAKEGSKRVIVFTDCDKPHKNDPDMMRRVTQKLRDLKDQDIGIDIMPVREDHEFDWNFYAEPLDMTKKECEERAVNTFEELLDRTLAKNYKRRAMANLMFQLGPGIEFGVGLYNLYSMANIPTATTLYGKTNEQVASARTFMDSETGEKILQVDLKKYQVYGGKKIALEKDEVDQLKSNVAKEAEEKEFGIPSSAAGMVLLGFKPQTYLKPSHFIQAGLFAFPEDKYVSGSSKLFRALLEKCAQREVMAICRLVARSNMAPRLVALVPQLEVKSESGRPEVPAGFNIVYLPYAEDFRDLEKVTDGRTTGNATTDQVQKARTMIRKLKMKSFEPQQISNPSLQKHYHAVEAIALDREEVEETKDDTVPNVDWMERKASKEMQEFFDAVFPEGYAPGGGKRKTLETGTPSKKPKSEGVDLEGEAKAHRLEKITVPVLRELCGQHGIKLHGTRKADLIEQINKHYGV